MSQLSGYTSLIIEEAQRIEHIGLILHRITSIMPGLQVLATGSWSLKLANRLKEPFTKELSSLYLHPLSFGEMAAHTDTATEHRMLEERVLYGYYPEVVTSPGKEQYLLQAISENIKRELCSLKTIRYPDGFIKLLHTLALQTGQVLILKGLADAAGLSTSTTRIYLQMLEEAFIIFYLDILCTAPDWEYQRGRKVYFYDTGLRNALASDFSPMESRADREALWENFCVSERMKRNMHKGVSPTARFWWTKRQEQIPYLEEHDGKFHAFDFRWAPSRYRTCHATFRKNYDLAAESSITPENCGEFLQ